MTEQEIRKQQFKDKINTLAKTVYEPEKPYKPSSQQEARKLATKYVQDTIYVANIEQLKEFVDRDCKGEPLEIIVESPYQSKEVTEDRTYLATRRMTPDYEQVVLATLKKYNLVQQDSQLRDYSFLFPKLGVE